MRTKQDRASGEPYPEERPGAAVGTTEVSSLEKPPEWSASARLGDDAGLFEPFERTLICPSCNRPLQILIAPVHLKAPVLCPRCSRPLSALLRREIRTRYPEIAKVI